MTERELDYEYFRTLLAEYDRDHTGELANLYYEARGEFVEPHTGLVIPLGTREVRGYRPDPYLYDKILYVEKNGLRPVFEAVSLGERYDLGLAFGQGFANEAARKLAYRLQTERATKIFVLHDADADGYNIAVTFAEETARMPAHHIEVVDLGLTWSAAKARNLTPEAVTRKRALPERLVERLEEEEPAGLAAFTGEQTRFGTRPTWRAQRVELNAFSSTALIAYVEERLREAGAGEKFFPPEEVAAAHARQTTHLLIRSWADEWLAERLDFEGIVAGLIAEFGGDLPADLIRVMEEAARVLARHGGWRVGTPVRHPAGRTAGAVR